MNAFKKLVTSILLVGFCLTSCHDDEGHNKHDHHQHTGEYDVHIHIHHPMEDATFASGQNVPIEADFTHDGIIHNVAIVLTNLITKEVDTLFKEHLHVEDSYEYVDATVFNVADTSNFQLKAISTTMDGSASVADSVHFIIAP